MHLEDSYNSAKFLAYMSHLMTKPTKWHVRPAKTRISLGICPVWSESLGVRMKKLGSLVAHWVQSEDSDQTGQMPRLIWVFVGRTSFCWFCHVVAYIFSYCKFQASAIAKHFVALSTNAVSIVKDKITIFCWIFLV